MKSVSCVLAECGPAVTHRRHRRRARIIHTCEPRRVGNAAAGAASSACLRSTNINASSAQSTQPKKKTPEKLSPGWSARAFVWVCAAAPSNDDGLWAQWLEDGQNLKNGLFSSFWSGIIYYFLTPKLAISLLPTTLIGIELTKKSQ